MANSAYTNRLSEYNQPPAMLDIDTGRRQITTPASGFLPTGNYNLTQYNKPDPNFQPIQQQQGFRPQGEVAPTMTAGDTLAPQRTWGQTFGDIKDAMGLQMPKPDALRGNTTLQSKGILALPVGANTATETPLQQGRSGKIQSVKDAINEVKNNSDQVIHEDKNTVIAGKNGRVVEVKKKGDELHTTVEDPHNGTVTTEVSKPDGTKEVKSETLTDKNGLLSRYTDHRLSRSIGDALLNYSIGYFGSGGDIKKGLAAGLQAGADTYKNKYERAQDEVAGEMQRLGFSNAQVRKYVETGELSPQAEAMVAKSLTTGTKAKTEGQQKASMGASQMINASNILSNLTDDEGKNYEESLTGYGGAAAQYWGENAPRIFQTKDWKKYQAAQKQWIEGGLRVKSGAHISDPEYDKYSEMFFVQPGDDESIVKQKRNARTVLELAMQTAGKDMTSDDSERIMNIIGSGQYGEVKRKTLPDGTSMMYLVSNDGKQQVPIKIK